MTPPNAWQSRNSHGKNKDCVRHGKKANGIFGLDIDREAVIKIKLFRNTVLNMGLFSRKPSYCSVCNKELTHKHKPKREWNVKGPLCGDCHFEKSKEYYEGKVRQPCVECGTTRKITDLWEPRWQWDMEGLLCKECFDKKEEGFGKKKNFCALCGAKMGLIRYNPKGKWKIDGQLCRKCWDEKKAELG